MRPSSRGFVSGMVLQPVPVPGSTIVDVGGLDCTSGTVCGRGFATCVEEVSGIDDAGGVANGYESDDAEGGASENGSDDEGGEANGTGCVV